MSRYFRTPYVKGRNLTTFNRLKIPEAFSDAPPPASPSTSTEPVNPLSAMFPPQVPNYLAEELNVELKPEPAQFNVDSLTGLDSPSVLCNRCVHGHILKSRAATQNRKPDGSPFYFLYGQCLRVTPPMSLDDLRVEHCNQFEARLAGDKSNV